MAATVINCVFTERQKKDEQGERSLNDGTMGILLYSIRVNVVKNARFDVAFEDWLDQKFPNKRPDSEVASTIAEAPASQENAIAKPCLAPD